MLWATWQDVPCTAAVAAAFAGIGKISNMRTHLGDVPNISTMSDVDVVKMWWWRVNAVKDTAQQDKWNITPQQWLATQGIPIVEPTPPAVPDPGNGNGSTGGTLDGIMTWAKANPLYAGGIALVAFMMLGGRRKLF